MCRGALPPCDPRPRQQPAHPQYANYWAPLTRKRHTMPHSAQPQHTNYWAPRTRKRHQQEHWPQRPTESSDPTQHAKGRTGDCPGPRKGTTTRRNVTLPPPPPLQCGHAPRATRMAMTDRRRRTGPAAAHCIAHAVSSAPAVPFPLGRQTGARRWSPWLHHNAAALSAAPSQGGPPLHCDTHISGRGCPHRSTCDFVR